MTKNKHLDKICIIITAVTLIITMLFMFGENLGLKALPCEGESDMFSSADRDGEWDANGAYEISLLGDTATVSGGAYLSGTAIHIIKGGKYLLSGTFNGQIEIAAEKTDTVYLMLDGVTLSNDSAAIYVASAQKVIITLKDGTESSVITNGTEDGIDGAIYSKDDLTVNGGGSLSVEATAGHGIVCNDSLCLTGGNITVNAEADAIHANDSVRISGSSLTLCAGDDGITAKNDDSTSFIYMESGSVEITSCYEGLEAGTVTVCGGDINIVSEDDGINACGNASDSPKIEVSGGNITVTNKDGRDADGFDSNGDIIISGGNILISVGADGGNCALDYGSENGGELRLDGGTVIACGGNSMLEGVSESSKQGFIMKALPTVSEKSRVTLTDADTNEILSEIIPCSFSALIVSSPKLNVGDTYTLSCGNYTEEITVDNSSVTSSFSMGGFGKADRNLGMNGAGDDSSANENGNFKNKGVSPFENGGEENGFSHFGKGEPPQMPEDGGTDNAPPVGDFDQNAPDMPDSNSDTAETPPNGGTVPEGNSEQDMPPFPKGEMKPGGNSQTTEKQNDRGQSAENSQSEESGYDAKNALIWVGISLCVLLLGIGFAAAFRFRR